MGMLICTLLTPVFSNSLSTFHPTCNMYINMQACVLLKICMFIDCIIIFIQLLFRSVAKYISRDFEEYHWAQGISKLSGFNFQAILSTKLNL